MPQDFSFSDNPSQSSRNKPKKSSFLQTLTMTMDIYVRPFNESYSRKQQYRPEPTASTTSINSKVPETLSRQQDALWATRNSPMPPADPVQTEIEVFEAENFDLYLEILRKNLMHYLRIDQEDWQTKKKNVYQTSLVGKLTKECEKQKARTKPVKKNIENLALISLDLPNAAVLLATVFTANVSTGLAITISATLAFLGGLGFKLNKLRHNKQTAKNLLPYVSDEACNTESLELISLLLTLQMTGLSESKKTVTRTSSLFNSSKIKPFKKESPIAKPKKNPFSALEQELEAIPVLAKKNAKRLFHNLKRYITEPKYSTKQRKIHTILMPKLVYADRTIHNVKKCASLTAFLGALAMSMDEETDQYQEFFYEILSHIRKETDAEMNVIRLQKFNEENYSNTFKSDTSLDKLSIQDSDYSSTYSTLTTPLSYSIKKTGLRNSNSDPFFSRTSSLSSASFFKPTISQASKSVINTSNAAITKHFLTPFNRSLSS